MKNKGLFSGITFIQWSAVLILVLIVFSLLIMSVAKSNEEKARKPSGHVNWEAGYLAHVVANSPTHTNIVMKDFLLQKNSLSDEEKIQLQDSLQRLADQTHIFRDSEEDIDPQEVTYIVPQKIALFIVHNEEVICAEKKIEEVTHELCVTKIVTSTINENPFGSRYSDEGKIHDYLEKGVAEGLTKLAQEYNKRGGTGWVVLPGETPIVMGAVVYS